VDVLSSPDLGGDGSIQEKVAQLAAQFA